MKQTKVNEERQAKIDILQEIYDDVAKNPEKKEFTVGVCDIFKRKNKELNSEAMESNYLPMGATHDPNAPYNEPESTEKKTVNWYDIEVSGDDDKEIKVLFKLELTENDDEININVLNFNYPAFYTNWPTDIECHFEGLTGKNVTVFYNESKIY